MADYWGAASGGNQLKATITSTQDVANNRSLVRVLLYISRTGGFVADSNMQVGVSVNGISAYWWQGYASYSTGLTLLSDTYSWVNHDAAGNGNATVVGAVYGGYTANPNVSVTVTTLTLPQIPRATAPSWTGWFETNTLKTITLNRPSGSGFTHEVYYSFGSLENILISSNATDSVDWTPPRSLSQQLPNAIYGVGTLRVVTKSGGTTVGTKTAEFHLSLDGTIIPTVNTVTYLDTNTTVKDNIGQFVQNLSDIVGSVTSTSYDTAATITTERIRLGSESLYPEGTPFKVTTSGVVTAYGEAVDSRARVGSKSANLNVLAYNPPQLNSWAVNRANSSGDLDPAGTYLRLDLNASVQSLIVASTQKNQIRIGIRTKPNSGGPETWVTRNTITTSQIITYNNNVLIQGGGIYLLTSSWDVELTITDNTGVVTIPLITTIPTGQVAIDINGVNVGVGKYHERGGLDVDGEIYSSNLRVQTSVDLPSGVMMVWGLPLSPNGWLLCDGAAVSRTTYSALFALLGTTYGSGNGSTTFNLPDLKGKVVVGRDSAQTEFDTMGESSGAKTHTLTAAQMPTHSHTTVNGGQTVWVTSATGTFPSGSYYGGGTIANPITGDAGSGAAHNNLQPYMVLNYIIKS